jgi:outer membrane receptor protein involved in Fe transport
VGPASTRAANVARAALRGEEWSATLEHARFVGIASGGWLSALHTEDPSLYTGRRLPQRPSRQAFARAAWRPGALTLSADVTHLGDNMLDPINFRRVPGRTLVGASLAVRWRAVTLALDGRNLGDHRAEDVGGFPLPGRTLGLALEWHRPALPAASTPHPMEIP